MEFDKNTKKCCKCHIKYEDFHEKCSIDNTMMCITCNSIHVTTSSFNSSGYNK